MRIGGSGIGTTDSTHVPRTTTSIHNVFGVRQNEQVVDVLHSTAIAASVTQQLAKKEAW